VALATDDKPKTVLRFSRDGKRLATAGVDGGATIWDATALKSRPAKKLTAEELTTAWEQLGDDGGKAHELIWRLKSEPAQAVSLLKERLRPAEAVDLDKVKRWLIDLDDDAFTVRQRASRELEKLGDQVEELLRQSAKDAVSLEVRIRVQALLARLDGGASPEHLQQMRALEVLEGVDTADGRELLRKLAKGSSGARLTREAEELLRRLEP
jgi:hypothetical protein